MLSLQKVILFFVSVGYFVYECQLDSTFTKDYPQYKLCVIPDKHSIYHFSKDTYQYLTKQLPLLKNCTHIYGSLVLQGLTTFEDGSEPDLSFLESIQEISGSLEIYENTVQRISLRNLRVIRGHNSNNTLRVYNNENKNKFLQELDLSNLRVIQNKHIVLGKNPGLPFLDTKVNWDEILTNPKIQHVSLHRRLANFTEPECHPSCEDWLSQTDNSTTKHCFGPGAHQCQPRSKCSANRNKWCRFERIISNGVKVEKPCDKDCTGGCTGSTNSDCQVCRHLFKHDRCVPSCDVTSNPNVRFGSSRKDQTVSGANSLFNRMTLTVGGLCTSSCPTSLLDQNENCQYVCDFDKYYKSNSSCLRCPHDRCYDQIGDTLVCNLQKMGIIDWQYLTLESLKKLTHCTTIVGMLVINDKSFLKGNIKKRDLYEHLSRVQEVIGDVDLDIRTTNITNLTFLYNLREIRGVADQFIIPGLKIYSETLKFMGLKNLRKVYGNINWELPHDSCYDNTIPWQEITTDRLAKSHCNDSCHPFCTRGCWGPTNEMCYRCELLEAGRACVHNCSQAAGFYSHRNTSSNHGNSGSGVECRRCHPLCRKSCTGPTARDCAGQCKWAKEAGECVKACSVDHYSVTTNGTVTCEPCHANCYVGEGLVKAELKKACTGISNRLGPGGCNMCSRAIRSTFNNSGLLCHLGDCPVGFFRSPLLEDNRVQLEIVYEPCHPRCSNCTDASTERSQCGGCDGFWHRDSCVASCPPDVRNYTEAISHGGECPLCHVQCKDGCHYANSSTSCLSCTKKKLYIDRNKNEFECVTLCPTGRNYTELDETDSLLCLRLSETQEHRQRRRVLIYLISCAALFGLLAIMLCCCCRWRLHQNKIRTELRALYSNYKEPNLKDINEENLLRPPNMHRLAIIPISELIFDINDKPLGAGAFGKVFKGQWKVQGPDNHTYLLDVVIKVIHNSSRASTDEFLDEARIMASVSHRHCLPLIGVCLTLDRPCLVSSFAKHGSLDRYMSRCRSSISSFSMLTWAHQIADGMAYLNIRGIVHRDLAARNILVCNREMVQITDFGLARLIEESSQNSITVKSGRVPIRWLALETLIYSTYSSATDVWAYGVTLWEIFTYCRRPYQDIETHHIRSYLQQGNRLYQPDICTLEVYMVMVKCWLENPELRPSFQDLIGIFEKFAIHSKHYLCLPRESRDTPGKNMSGVWPPDDSERMCLQPSSMREASSGGTDEPLGPVPVTVSTIMTGYGPSYGLDSATASPGTRPAETLPSRKRRRNLTAMSVISSHLRRSLSSLLPNKQQNKQQQPQQDQSQHPEQKQTSGSLSSKLCVFPPEDVLIKNANSSSYDSSSGLLAGTGECAAKVRDPMSALSREGSRSPQNPRVAQLKVAGPTVSQSLSSPGVVPRVFRDEHDPKLVQNGTTIVQIAHGIDPDIECTDCHKTVEAVSLDSGNSHQFEADDRSSRIQSSGYYNMTPSPSTNLKSPGHPLLHEPTNFLLETFNDGYLEPMNNNPNCPF